MIFLTYDVGSSGGLAHSCDWICYHEISMLAVLINAAAAHLELAIWLGPKKCLWWGSDQPLSSCAAELVEPFLNLLV